MNKKMNRVLSMFLILIFIVSTLPINVIANNNVDNETLLTEKLKTEDKTEETKNTKEKEVNTENNQSFLPEDDDNNTPNDAVELSEDSELIEISPSSIEDLPAVKSQNIDTELPAEASGNKINKLSVKWIDAPNEKTFNIDGNSINNNLFSLRFRIDLELSGQGVYDAGDVSISVPKNIFRTRQGGTTGIITFAVPEAPGKGAVFAYTELEDKYLITNTKKILSSSIAYIEGTIKSVFIPDVKDKITGYISDDFFANLKIDFKDKNNSIQTIGMKSNAINATVDTFARVLETQYGYYKLSNLADDIPSELHPKNPNDYFYITWLGDTHIAANQPFSLRIKSDLNSSIDSHRYPPINGKILGYMLTSSGKVIKNNSNTNNIDEVIHEGDFKKK